MDHYVDIRVLPTPEIPEPHLLSRLAGKLHLALTALRCDDVGVSFPCHKLRPPSLGNLLRLHGSHSRLEQVMMHRWTTGLSDYVRISEVTSVPETASFCMVRRVQVRSSAERIRRRLMKRHGWSAEEAQARVPNTLERRLNLPYLSLRSSSTGQSFRLFIEHCPTHSPVPGPFNAYGLSQSATIPWF